MFGFFKRKNLTLSLGKFQTDGKTVYRADAE